MRRARSYNEKPQQIGIPAQWSTARWKLIFKGTCPVVGFGLWKGRRHYRRKQGFEQAGRLAHQRPPVLRMHNTFLDTDLKSLLASSKSRRVRHNRRSLQIDYFER
jgi:hypothetical protein